MPAITSVVDAGSYTPGVAQGSIFVVQGTNLSASGLVYTSFPLPTSLSGVSVSFTPSAGGSSTNAYIIYLYNENGRNQLATLLPSSLAVASYNVTVTNNGATSAPFQVNVVQRKPEIISQDGSGTGLALVQNYVSASEADINRFTVGVANGSYISPARPVKR